MFYGVLSSAEFYDRTGSIITVGDLCQEVAGLLLHPFGVGLRRRCRDDNLPRVQVNEYEHV